MTFSRAQSLQDALDVKLRRAKIMAKNQANPTFNIEHAGDLKEWSTVHKHTALIKRITEQVQKKQLRNETFTRKLHQNG